MGEMDMPTLVFDTYDYIKKLRVVGVPEEQAAIHAETIAGLINEELATKRDLKELEASMKHDLAAMKHDLKELELSMKRDLANFKADLIKWVFAICGAQAALIVTLVKRIK
jgi:hypothetical protein